MDTGKLLVFVLSAMTAMLGWAGTEAFKWQKEQDETAKSQAERINDLDKLLIRQQAILEFQVEINERALKPEEKKDEN